MPKKKFYKNGKKNGKKRANIYPYRSQFEKDLHERSLRSCEYEPIKVKYMTETTYTPDFIPKNKKYWIEAKGYFRTYQECAKYLWIQRSHPNIKLVFVFPNPHSKAYPQCKLRKDGTFLSLAEWCKKNGFEFATPSTIPKRWLK